ncbi:nitrogen regulation protein NR(II) [Candidatus Omnitrophota bacterium]
MRQGTATLTKKDTAKVTKKAFRNHREANRFKELAKTRGNLPDEEAGFSVFFTVKKGTNMAKRKSAPKKTKGSSRAKTSTPQKNISKKDVGLMTETDSILRELVDKEKEIVQTEDALVESMKRFRDLFEQSPIGVGIHGVKGELLVVNKAYKDIFRAASFGDIRHENLFTDMGLPSKETKGIRSGKVIQYEGEYNFEKAKFEAGKEGKSYILLTISPLLRDDNVIGYMVQAQDVTSLRKAEESQRLAQLGRLLSDMAHEVNNPLMIISGRAELTLLDKSLNRKMKDSLNTILDQCFSAKDIIQRLLRYSRLGKMKKTSVDVDSSLELISEILQHHFKMADITFKKEIKGKLPTVMGNEKQLQEVLMNMMRNSADAMPGGGVITVRAEKDGSFLKITIEDNGTGMPQKVLDRIFEPFFTTKQKGTGLGLAVSHTIIQEHGGELIYESTEGKGTKAMVLLPI